MHTRSEGNGFNNSFVHFIARNHAHIQVPVFHYKLQVHIYIHISAINIRTNIIPKFHILNLKYFKTFHHLFHEKKKKINKIIFNKLK